jgi:hypothetical protein
LTASRAASCTTFSRAVDGTFLEFVKPHLGASIFVMRGTIAHQGPIATFPRYRHPIDR